MCSYMCINSEVTFYFFQIMFPFPKGFVSYCKIMTGFCISLKNIMIHKEKNDFVKNTKPIPISSFLESPNHGTSEFEKKEGA